ncbi:MAG: hypothetical protein P8Y00_05135, partial [Deltaproteobacteria bacterium]
MSILNTRNGIGNGVFNGLWKRPFLLLNSSFFLVFSNVSLFYHYPLVLEDMGATPEMVGWIMG